MTAAVLSEGVMEKEDTIDDGSEDSRSRDFWCKSI